MKKNVLITVTGLLYTGSGEDERDYIDVITPGQYYYRDERHYLVYEEQIEGCEIPIRNLITISPGRVGIRKTGVVSTEMSFEPNRETGTWYSTPFGRLEMTIYTQRICMRETEENIDVEVRYRLLVGGNHHSDCFVRIRVEPQGEESSFSLVEETQNRRQSMPPMGRQ